jgi:hypothetical protein
MKIEPQRDIGSTPKTGAVELLITAECFYSDSKITKISHTVFWTVDLLFLNGCQRVFG